MALRTRVRTPGAAAAVAVATARTRAPRVSSRKRGAAVTAPDVASTRGRTPPRQAPPTSSQPEASLGQSTQGVSPNSTPAAKTAHTSDDQGPGQKTRASIAFPTFETSAGPPGTLVTDPGTSTREGPASGQDGAGDARSLPAPQLGGDDELFTRQSVFDSPPPAVALAQTTSAFQPPPAPRRSLRVSPPSATAPAGRQAAKRNAPALAPRLLVGPNVPAGSSADAVKEDATFVEAPALVNVAPASGIPDIDLSGEPLNALELLNDAKKQAARDRRTNNNLNLCLEQALETSSALQMKVKDLEARLLTEKLRPCLKCHRKIDKTSQRQPLQGPRGGKKGGRKKKTVPSKAGIVAHIAEAILRIDQEKGYDGDLIKVSRRISEFQGGPGIRRILGTRYYGHSHTECFLTFVFIIFNLF